MRGSKPNDEDTAELERTHFTHGHLTKQKINPREWSVGRRIKSEVYETSLCLLASKSERLVVETAYDRLDRTSS